MKLRPLSLAAAAALCLPSCVTLTGELTLPGGGKSGGFGGKIGGSWTWPGKAAEPALPEDGSGKTPVLLEP